MDVVFDTADGSLRIDAVGPLRAGCEVRALLDRHGQKRVNISGVRMSLEVRVEGVTRHAVTLPPSHVRYERTDADLLAGTRVPYDAWRPDEEVAVEAKLWRVDGSLVVAQRAFVGARPSKPYASWVWDAEKDRYTAPVPRPLEEPEEGKFWAWSEDALEWVQEASSVM